jgi:hypothetical protein
MINSIGRKDGNGQSLEARRRGWNLRAQRYQALLTPCLPPLCYFRSRVTVVICKENMSKVARP